MAGPTAHPFGKAFGCAVVAAILIYLSLRLSFGPPGDASYIAGYIFGLAMFPAIVVGIWAWRSTKTWSLFRIAATYAVILLICGAIALAGSMNRASHESGHASIGSSGAPASVASDRALFRGAALANPLAAD